ncbi:hypothetical protein D7Y09_17885 [bacterium 1XD42-1]|nr:hypothetical protein D7Y09_17885 [bacterium 1XD42-1]
MCHRQGSAGSARPISEQCKNMVESAGIAVQPNEIGNKNLPAQEQAASRSREQMFSWPKPQGTPSQKQAVQQVARQFRQRPSHTDPNGSWTGVPENPMEVPVQDADDL